MDITVKSTASLIDELITTRFKVEVNPSPEIIERMRELDTAVRLRLNGKEDDIFLQVIKLQIILRQCWNAQEVLTIYKDLEFQQYIHTDHRILKKITTAALQAQKTNGERNKLIREIDDILGESSVSPLGKTYG